MMNPNKDRVTTIVASISKDKNGNPTAREEFKKEAEPITDTMAAKEAAMDSMLIAIDKKDSRGMVRAMKTFMELCEYGEEEDVDDSGENGNSSSSAYDRRDKNPYYSG